jgi:predicted heme/steroid binding protein
MQTFTPQELAQHDGRAGAPVYIAYAGKVYDASDSWLWKSGRHQVTHPAGVDYTDPADGLSEAPHGPDLLERLPVIGALVDDQPAADPTSGT